MNPDLLSKRLLVVTGKGGVGKSTITAGLALLAAEQGRTVLVVEVDAKGNLTDFFEHGPVGFEPQEVHPGVHVLTMDTEASLREYLKLHLRVPMMGRIGPVARAFDFVATAAPGVKEILTVGKICYEVREELSVPLGGVILNRVLPELFTRDEEAVFEALREPGAAEQLAARVGAGAPAVLEGARLAVTLRRTRAAHLQRLRDSTDLPLMYLPYLFTRSHGMRVTRMIAESLGEEMGL